MTEPYEYRCPVCNAHVVSGWADARCPIPSCGAIMDVLGAPDPPPDVIEQMLAEAERAKAPLPKGEG